MVTDSRCPVAGKYQQVKAHRVVFPSLVCGAFVPSTHRKTTAGYSFKGLQYRAKKKALEKKAFRVLQPFYHPLSSYAPSVKIPDFKRRRKKKRSMRSFAHNRKRGFLSFCYPMRTQAPHTPLLFSPSC